MNQLLRSDESVVSREINYGLNLAAFEPQIDTLELMTSMLAQVAPSGVLPHGAGQGTTEVSGKHSTGAQDTIMTEDVPP